VVVDGATDDTARVAAAAGAKIVRHSINLRYGRSLKSGILAGQRIDDINSGMRVFRRSQILPFFPIISAGFSFTTTSTLAYLLNDLSIRYLPIEYRAREGRSKVRHFRDSLRALQIILEAILRCNPIKAFILLVAPLVALSALLFPLAILSGSSLFFFIGRMLL